MAEGWQASRHLKVGRSTVLLQLSMSPESFAEALLKQATLNNKTSKNCKKTLKSRTVKRTRAGIFEGTPNPLQTHNEPLEENPKPYRKNRSSES